MLIVVAVCLPFVFLHAVRINVFAVPFRYFVLVDPISIILQVMVTNVTSLLKTVKAVEDEHTRGTRALESSIEAIAQEIRAFDSNDAPRQKAEAEDLVRATRPITLATGKAVSAGNSCKQEDIIVAANMGRKAISDMLITCKVRSTLYLTRVLHLQNPYINS